MNEEYIDELKAAESSNVVSKFHRINDEILEKEQDEIIKDLKETFNIEIEKEDVFAKLQTLQVVEKWKSFLESKATPDAKINIIPSKELYIKLENNGQQSIFDNRLEE